jgi:hypothetical protein
MVQATTWCLICAQWRVTKIITFTFSCLSVRSVVTTRKTWMHSLSHRSHPQNGICVHVFINVCVFFFMCLCVNKFWFSSPVSIRWLLCMTKMCLHAPLKLCFFFHIFSYIFPTSWFLICHSNKYSGLPRCDLSHWVWIPNVLKEYTYLELLGSVHPTTVSHPLEFDSSTSVWES